MNLKNQRILIIGGTSGFGAEVARQALKKESDIHVIGHSEQRLSEFLDQTNGVMGQAIDARDPQALTAFFETQEPFDHVISTLGGAMGGGFLDSSLALIRKTIEEKFFVNLQLAKIASKHLKRHGSLIFTSGSGGHPSDASGAIVGNQAINTMVAGLAVEMAPDYRVNAVSPTWTPTGLWRSIPATELEKQAATFAKNVPLKRVGTVEEVASAYLYCMENEFMTGQIMRIDGGVDL
ncbi:short-chain dehydrogenase/oxidoreductase [Pediococcus damnosus]|uniref:Short-chain dehydrogenase/oxidoreductase n=1 Tax=Pediococcus damnosus TaxID=51663 RepID=A0A0R2HU10_9LACO|nr:SDR family oxidoreductase [Pediococcus damnosus]AMV60296.1 short-chain dehydrogenase/oxidoreductase [Pediococcus damnosus]AMV62826.1 short-chain dehydrogenase/oxidoreductase [Pediococcus damnosus]AMV64546.1 short-chain dehydrogenase/oxidoreductase [Pediococcus damnosus]AMV67289.1 short-chain dehydrogenase/oxidoreductase [Pediococcus damnosus]AMV69591.1 short-chain dehydrogenase/oxidoreductase [Pediococcus damnosus]